MNALIFAPCVVFAACGLSAQTTGWQPSPGHTQIPIWPGGTPDAQPLSKPEIAAPVDGQFVVQDATGGLAGLRGTGTFHDVGPAGTYTVRYHFDP